MLRKYVVPAMFSLLVVGATIAAALNAGDDPDPGEDRRVPALVIVGSIVILALSAFVNSTRPMREELRQESRVRFRRKLERRLGAVLVALYDNPDDVVLQTKMYEVGLHVWLIPGWYRAITPRWRVRQRIPERVRNRLRKERWTPELRRRAKVRLEEREMPANISWRRGKGVIGRCWDTHDVVCFNSEEKYEPYRDFDEQQWMEQVPNDIRMNLGYSDFKRLFDRYGDVVAVPVFKPRDDDGEEHEFVGVLAFDTPLGSHESEDTLNKIVIPILRSGAKRIAEAL